MLTYEEALERLLARVPEPRIACLPLQESWGRVLAEPIVADLDLPPFRKSFVDGYAVRSQDVANVPITLQIIGTAAAGNDEQLGVGRGQTVRMMTGAAVPAGADGVQMIEKSRQLDVASVEILEPVQSGENVAPLGHEVSQGSVVLQPGRVLRAAEIGVLATFGRQEVQTYAAPTAAVFSTGNEIVEISERPRFGQIRNSNAHMLRAQCAEMGLSVRMFPVVPDDPERTRQAVEQGLVCDLILLTGGVSMGERDYVHQVLREMGVEIFFHKAAIKPGKPVLVGHKEGHLIFGLPGNPVSAFVTFELFVRPAVRRWMGFKAGGLARVWAELATEVRQKPGRKFFKPARTQWTQKGFRAEPVETKGSADLVAFSQANSLIIVEADLSHLPAGRSVEVLLLEHYFEKGAGYEIDACR